MAKQQVIPPSFEVSYDMLASKNRRFANYVIDSIVIVLMLLVIITSVVIIAILFELHDLLIWMQQIPRVQSYAIGAVFSTAYFFIFEAAGATTFGKLITGTKVVMAETGAKPAAGTILKRSLVRLIPFQAFSFLGEGSTGWHDSISGTTVVDVKKYNDELYLKISFEEFGKQQKVA
jgi:uncharacterized RDD family membrane protein YckC